MKTAAALALAYIGVVYWVLRQAEKLDEAQNIEWMHGSYPSRSINESN